MQVPNEQKRRTITTTAAKMFASQPFHKVRLEDIAAEAGVGKGTLYIYFQSKEELYFSLIYEGFATLVDRLEAQIADSGCSPTQCLERIVHELVAFAFKNPQLFELTRNVGIPAGESGRK